MTDTLQGFAIPFRFERGGVAKQTDSHQKLKENIIQILMTRVGERVMRRDYGGGIHQLVHDPNNEALRAIVQHQIAKSIGQWEPRVQLKDIRISQQEGTLTADISYVLRQSPEQLFTVSVPLGLGGI